MSDNLDLARLLFVYNPNAGRGIVKNYLSAIIEIFCKAGYEVTVYATAKSGDAACIVENCGSKFDRIACCGGDGTLNEVTDGLMKLEHKPPCGYIPAGTVNDFAHSFNLPNKMVEAAKVVVEGKPFLYDIGSLNGDYFDYIAAFGAFTEVSYETSQSSKNILGKLAYFFEGVKRLPSIRKYKVRIQVGDEIVEDEIIYGMITNSFTVGGFLSLFDESVELNDGKFEALFIKTPKNVIELQSIVNALLGNDTTCKYFYYYNVSDISISSDEAISWTVDGEFGGTYCEVNIKNHYRALSFIRGIKTSNGK